MPEHDATSRHTLIETAECEIETITVDDMRALRGDEAVGVYGTNCTTPSARSPSLHRRSWVRRLASVGRRRRSTGFTQKPRRRRSYRSDSR
jgi:hypothetical protein